MKKFTCNFSQSSMAGEKIIGFARPVFKDKPSSAPQEAPKSQEQMDEAPSLDHMKKEVERFENNIKGFLKNMEEFYNQGMPKEMQITISTTEKPADNPELMKKYKAAGMGENAIEAIDALVDGLNLMKSAIAEKEDSNRIILARINAAATSINDIMKKMSPDDLYGAKIYDPLKAEMTPAKMEELHVREEEKKAEEAAPEVVEATTDQKVQGSIEAMLRQDDHMVDVEALLQKCGGKQFEIKKEEGDKLYTKEMAKDNLLRAVVTPSTDGQSVRIEWWITGKGHQNLKGIRQEIVYNKDPERKDAPKFPQSSEGQESQQNLEKNRAQLRKDVEWLKKAPVGSKIVVSDTIVFLKDADGELYVVKMENGEEQSRAKYEEEGVEEKEGLVTAEGGISILDATDEQKKQATELYREGGKAREKGQLDTALAKFKEAYKIVASPNIHLQIVDAYYRTGAYDQALAEGKACLAEYDKLLPQVPAYADDRAVLVELIGKIEARLTKGSIMFVEANQKPERVQADAPESKELAQKRINKIAKDLIMAASAPQVGDMPKIIKGMAEKIGKLAKANNITEVRMEGTGATGHKHFVEIADNKVAWGPVMKEGEDAQRDTGVRYAQGEIEIDSGVA